jgi:hypothetical protein
MSVYTLKITFLKTEFFLIDKKLLSQCLESKTEFFYGQIKFSFFQIETSIAVFLLLQ